MPAVNSCFVTPPKTLSKYGTSFVPRNIDEYRSRSPFREPATAPLIERKSHKMRDFSGLKITNENRTLKLGGLNKSFHK